VTLQLAHAPKKTKRSDHAERSGKMVPLDFNSNLSSAKVRTNAVRRVVCKTKGRELCFEFLPDQGATKWGAREKSPTSANKNPVRDFCYGDLIKSVVVPSV
jgi:hypothetical protein